VPVSRTADVVGNVGISVGPAACYCDNTRWQASGISMACMSGYPHGSNAKALFICIKFWVQSTVALSFVFNNYYSVMG